MKEEKEPITPYHWIVVIIASLGWLFDCMDQRLFALSRESAIASLLGPDATSEAIKSGLMTATTWMILGWATGGIIFGILSDRWGRVKTMAATLLLYSIFTGLSGFSQGIFDFMIYRFWLVWEWVACLGQPPPWLRNPFLPGYVHPPWVPCKLWQLLEHDGVRYFPFRASWFTRWIIWIRGMALAFLLWYHSRRACGTHGPTPQRTHGLVKP
jgi:MFS family permease